MKLSILSSIVWTAHREAFSKLLVVVFAHVTLQLIAKFSSGKKVLQTHVVVHCGGFKTHFQILRHYPPQEVASMSSPFEPWWYFVTVLINTKLQKWFSVISKAVKKVTWLLLVLLEAITLVLQSL